MKTIAGLFALLLLLGACADDDAEGADTTEAVSAANASTEGADDTDSADESASGSDSAGDSDDTGTDEANSADGAETNDDTDNQSASTDGSDDLLPADSALSFVFATIGVEPTEEIISCIEEAGADPLTGFDASDAETTAISLATIRCLNDELASFGARTFPPTPGVESDDVECVLQEAYGYVGELSQQEAEAVVGANDISPEIEAEIVDRATAQCGVTPEVASDILDFLAS